MADPAADLAACVQALQDIIAYPAKAATIAEGALAKIMMRRMGVTVGAEGRKPVKIPDLPVGGWAKWVFGVNPKEKGGFAFEGPFLRPGDVHPLPVHALVLIVAPADSLRQRAVHLCTVTDQGDLSIWWKDRQSQWWIEAKRVVDKALTESGLHHFVPKDAAAALALVGPHEPPDHTAV